jgi:hypothetical protein
MYINDIPLKDLTAMYNNDIPLTDLTAIYNNLPATEQCTK